MELKGERKAEKQKNSFSDIHKESTTSGEIADTWTRFSIIDRVEKSFYAASCLRLSFVSICLLTTTPFFTFLSDAAAVVVSTMELCRCRLLPPLHSTFHSHVMER